MKNGNVEIIRNELKKIADERFASSPIKRASAHEAVDLYCDAKIAYKELNANTITSYSIQGKSITKRNIDDIPFADLIDTLALYFTEDEIPESIFANRSVGVDFSWGAL